MTVFGAGPSFEKCRAKPFRFSLPPIFAFPAVGLLALNAPNIPHDRASFAY